MPTTAGSVINRVRVMIPDAVYDSAGVPAPGTDGSLFRVVDLYNFLNDGIRIVTQRTGWVVQDWTAIAVVSGQPIYPLDEKWINVDEVFKDLWRHQRVDEAITIWPNLATTTKSLWYSTHKITDHWEIALFPAPSTNEPTPTLSATLSNIGTVATLSSIASFNTYGYMSVDDEIVFYGSVNSANISVNPLRRGQAGTTVATHNNSATCTHLTIWAQGRRVPLSVTTSTDNIELPPTFIFPLQTYVLARCREAENEFQEAARLMQEFDGQMQRILEDPKWKNNQGMQVLEYGQPLLGALAYGRVIIPTIFGILTWLW